MRISRVKLNNYVCFYDEKAEWIDMGPGFNFVVGKNNAGKSALLAALSTSTIGDDWKSTQPWRFASVERLGSTAQPRDAIQFEIHFEYDFGEIADALERDGQPFFVPVYGDRFYSVQDVEDEVRRILEDRFTLRVYFGHESGPEASVVSFDKFRTTGPLGTCDAIHFTIQGGKIVSSLDSFMRTDLAKIEARYRQLATYAIGNTFKFSAERPVVPKSKASTQRYLTKDASNLATVLNATKAQYSHRYEEYFGYVRIVLPSIEELLLIPNGDTVEMKISYLRASLEKPQYAIRLDDCGTGVAQILAILYVVTTETSPKIIIIDEPFSFLHPGAVRKLLEIFQEHSHHQYIISTHTPTAIMAVKQKQLLLVTRTDMISQVESVNVHDNSELEAALREIGSRRSDIFGMDAVIWVEGKTDETCFKLIMDKAGDGLPFGTNISALVNADDLKSEYNAELAVEIYKSLSGGVGLLPSVLAFVFDGDKRGEHNKLTNSGYRIEYLPRQNYESYLIAPEILAEILNRDAADDKCKDHSADCIATWIRNKEGCEYDDPEWLETVDGAKLLDCMFNDLAGISYKDNKVAYGEEITRRILESDPDHFCDIVKLIRCILRQDSEQ